MSDVVLRSCTLFLTVMMVPAGVSGSAAVEEPADVSAAPYMEQYGCRSSYSGHAVPAAWARERLPAGFQPRAAPIFWTPVGGGNLGAFLMVKTWSCERTQVDGTDVEAGSTYLYYLAVLPPASLRESGRAAYWFPLEVIATSPDEAAVYETWGLHGTVEGPVTIDETEAAAGRVVHVVADSGTNRFDTLLLLPSGGAEQNGFVVRYFAFDGTDVTGYIDIDVLPHQGAGYASALRFDGPDDPWGRPSVGTSASQSWAPEELSYVWTHTTV